MLKVVIERREVLIREIVVLQTSTFLCSKNVSTIAAETAELKGEAGN